MKVIKIILKLIITVILAVTLYVIYIISVHYINFQKVYNSYEDKKLSHNIENKLEKMAKKVRKTKKPLSVNFNELTKNRQIDKLCIVGPYNSDINELMGVDWKQAKLWERNVVNYDRLFSIFIIYENNVIPIKINRADIISYTINKSCISSNNNVNLELIEDHSKVYLKITN